MYVLESVTKILSCVFWGNLFHFFKSWASFCENKTKRELTLQGCFED